MLPPPSGIGSPRLDPRTPRHSRKLSCELAMNSTSSWGSGSLALTMRILPLRPMLDSFASYRIFQRCCVHRSLSGVAPLLEAANAGGYKRCQHSWLL
jgi:hypothetical protein